MSLKLNSSGGGSVTLQEPSTATNGTLTLPAGTGTVAVNGLSSNIVSGTAVATTSGTAINFTDIPSWVKRITVMFAGISTNGASKYQVQLGAGSVTTSGYSCSYAQTGVATANGTLTSGIGGAGGGATDVFTGNTVFTLISGNTWVATGNIGYVGAAYMYAITGSITLSGTLDRVRITTVNGTDTFDAGTINILYE